MLAVITSAVWCRLHKDEDWREIAAELAEFEQLCQTVAAEYSGGNLSARQHCVQ